MNSPAEILIVSPGERVYAPTGRPRERIRAFAIAAAAVLYMALTAGVIYESRYAPRTIPQEEETPVEIVVQPPSEPPPPPPEEKKQDEAKVQPPPDLAPAYEAPREGKDEKVDSAADPDKSKPPPPAGTPDAPDVAKAAPPPAPETPPAPAPEPSAPPIPMGPDAEETAPPPKPAAPAPAPLAAPPALAKGKPVPMFASLEDVVGGAAMKAPVAGGNGPAGYTNIILGQILPQFHKLKAAVPASRAHYGKIEFTVDATGRLNSRYISEESGSPELDRAAMEALARAGPFPPPPFRGNIGLYWKFGPNE